MIAAHSQRFPQKLPSCKGKANLEAKHGVDPGVARRFGRRVSRHKRREWRLLIELLGSCGLLLGSFLGRGRRTTGCGDALRSGFGGGFRLSRLLLEIGEITRLFRTRLNGRKRQIHLVLHRTRDAVQLPDELFELFRATQVQVAVPQKADRQYYEDGQPGRQCGEHDRHKQRVERGQGLRHGASNRGASRWSITHRDIGGKRIDLQMGHRSSGRVRCASPYGRSQYIGLDGLRRKDMEAMLRESLQDDDQLLVHSVGDRTAEAFLNAMEAIGGKAIWSKRRPRIETASCPIFSLA